MTNQVLLRVPFAVALARVAAGLPDRCPCGGWLVEQPCVHCSDKHCQFHVETCFEEDRCPSCDKNVMVIDGHCAKCWHDFSVCPQCLGDGTVEVNKRASMDRGGFATDVEECDVCDGSGEMRS